jgi:Inhibitor of growth proteins N-terminal histone-binding
MSSDETYLEAFVESLSTLPHEIRRNMDLIRDLDKLSTDQADVLRTLQQQYIHDAEDRMMQLEIATLPGDGSSFGVRVLDGDDVIIPTTYELLQYVKNEELYRQIQASQEDCLQKADEKVAIAQQALDRVDATCQRLDEDIAAMEELLQSSGDYLTKQYMAKPNDLAACQVSPNSEWILAKVIQHDPHTGMYKLADEDVESNKSTFQRLTGVLRYCCVCKDAYIYAVAFDVPVLIAY